MRKTILILLAAISFSACGGSGSSSLSSNGLSGSYLSSTVELDQQFVYALSSDQSKIAAYRVAGESEGGHGHDHGDGHVHAQADRVLAHEGHDHDDDHDHDDHGHGEHDGHDHGGGDSALDLVELDGSPFTLTGGQALSLVVAANGRSVIVLFADGNLRSYPINGTTGLLGEPSAVPSRADNPRKLRLSPAGDSIAVLGDSLSLFPVDEQGGIAPLPAILGATQNWVDVALGDHGGAASTAQGAVGFHWHRGGPVNGTAEVVLPGTTRGGLVITEEAVFVTNTENQSISELAQDEEGQLTLVSTSEVPHEAEDPATITALFGGEDLLVGGSHGVALLHHHDGELEEEGHLELDQVPTELFGVPDSNYVLVAHADGEGFHLLEVGEGLTLVGEFETELAKVTSFGVARRVEIVTVTEAL